MSTALKQLIQKEARRLGFVLAGVTPPHPPPHLSAFEGWLAQGRHASMDYLASDRSHARRADPRLILPECKSILVLAVPYSPSARSPIIEKDESPSHETSLSKIGGQEAGHARLSAMPRTAGGISGGENALQGPEPEPSWSHDDSLAPSSKLGPPSSHDAPLPSGDREAPRRGSRSIPERSGGRQRVRGRIAAYASGDDYHLVLPARLQAMVEFIESQVGHPVSNRWYTDTGPILERDLAQRAGLGWIGKNTCLINPKQGSYFLLAEIFLDLELEPDAPFETDHCGTCTRCIDACPTDCILPDRTIDAGRCISYLTIELKDRIPTDLRPLLDNWIFGCDICQTVCPWNRFAAPQGDPAFGASSDSPQPDLARELQLTRADFNRKFKNSPVRRTKRRGYLRNVAVALGNAGTAKDLPALEEALNDSEPLVSEHAAWAIERINKRM